MYRNKKVIMTALTGFGLIAVYLLYLSNKQRMPVPQLVEYVDESNSHLDELRKVRVESEQQQYNVEQKTNSMDKYVALLSPSVRPVEFYGRVLDQNGVPVENAEVIFSAGGVPYVPGTGRGSIMTDSNGMFGLAAAGVQGATLSIGPIRKNGYEYKSASNQSLTNSSSFAGFKDSYESLWWENYTADDPYHFVMWKVEQNVNISLGEKRYYFSNDDRNLGLDGENYFINLDDHVSRRYVEPEQKHFGASFTRTETEWQLTMIVENGGFVEISPDQLYMNEPPVNGYQEKIVLKGIKNVPRSNNYRKSYYLETAGGLFARLELEIRPFHNKNSAALSVKYALNTDGTRYLAVGTR